MAGGGPRRAGRPAHGDPAPTPRPNTKCQVFRSARSAFDRCRAQPSAGCFPGTSTTRAGDLPRPVAKAEEVFACRADHDGMHRTPSREVLPAIRCLVRQTEVGHWQQHRLRPIRAAIVCALLADTPVFVAIAARVVTAIGAQALRVGAPGVLCGARLGLASLCHGSPACDGRGKGNGRQQSCRGHDVSPSLESRSTWTVLAVCPGAHERRLNRTFICVCADRSRSASHRSDSGAVSRLRRGGRPERSSCKARPAPRCRGL